MPRVNRHCHRIVLAVGDGAGGLVSIVSSVEDAIVGRAPQEKGWLQSGSVSEYVISSWLVLPATITDLVIHAMLVIIQLL